MKVRLKTFLGNKLYTTIGLMMVCILLTFPKLNFYIKFDFNFFLFIFALPFVLRKQSSKKSIRYGILAIILLLLFPILKVRSVFFFAFVSTLLFIYEYQYGKLSSIPLFLVIIISPVAIFLSEVVGFEIRLWLTEVATYFLQYIDPNYHHSGNIILIGEHEFHVDTACMGLKMVLLSLFITLIFLSYQQQQKNTHTHAFIIILFLMISYLLTIISNLTRIILITIFESHPETLSHEFIGILCFITYTVIPLWFLVKLIPIHSIKKKSQIGTTFNYTIFKSLIMVLLSLFTLYRFTDIGSKEKIQPEFVSLHYFSEDFSSSLEDHNVIKLTNEDYLIYVKQAPNFYAADHSPIICWKGSGYEVTKEQIITTANAKVYFSELKKNQDVLYSTWWYDSGNDKTILQHKWRFNNLVNGDRYHLINVVSNNKNDLLKKTNTLLSDNIFGE